MHSKKYHKRLIPLRSIYGHCVFRVHVHCPVCKQVQISYIIRPQNLKNLKLWLEFQRKTDFHTKKRDRSYKKGYDPSEKRHGAQEKGMALEEKGMAQPHAKRAYGETLILKIN